MPEFRRGLTQRPWASGPVDLLEHAVDHIAKGQTFDLRIAMISIDNAVELIARAYLTMPDSSRGCPGPPKKEYEEQGRTFPGLLQLLRKYGKEELDGVLLEDVSFYHDVRNKLYHEIYPLSPSPADVDTYLQLAKLLLRQLLASTTPPAVARVQGTNRGRFLLAWEELLDRVYALSDHVSARGPQEGRSLQSALRILEAKTILSPEARERLLKIAEVRNEIVHGTGGPFEEGLADVVPDLYSLMGELGDAERRLMEGLPPRRAELSAQAQELLVASLPSGELRAFQVDQFPSPWIRAGRVDFLRQDDPSFAARYFDALKELMQEGYARHESRQLYVLTSAGFDLARELAGSGESLE